MSWLRSGFSVLWLALTGIAYAGQIPQPTEQQSQQAAERWPGTTLGTLKEGRKLFVQKCSGCHNLPMPSKHSNEQWPKLIDEMAKKAKLNEEQKQLILRYLVTVTTGPVR